MSDDLKLDGPQTDANSPENGTKPRRKRTQKAPVTPPHWSTGELPDQPIPVYYGSIAEDDKTVPVEEAFALIADQQSLFELHKPFNFEGAWIAVAEKAEEVKTIAGIYERDAATAKQSKKDLEAAESTLRAMIATLDDRRLQQARAAAQRAEDADSLEALAVKATAAGKVVDVASLRAMTADERAALETEIARSSHD
jgi:hypothetical protein